VPGGSAKRHPVVVEERTAECHPIQLVGSLEFPSSDVVAWSMSHVSTVASIS